MMSYDCVSLCHLLMLRMSLFLVHSIAANHCQFPLFYWFTWLCFVMGIMRKDQNHALWPLGKYLLIGFKCVAVVCSSMLFLY